MRSGKCKEAGKRSHRDGSVLLERPERNYFFLSFYEAVVYSIELAEEIGNNCT